MPDAYQLQEARYIQEIVAASAADATAVGLGRAVPAGKVWTILSGEYHPSVAETKIVHFNVVSRAINTYVISEPVSVALTASRGWPVVREGFELKLFPGESLQAVRDSATAGSTMVIAIRFIETDLPLYTYDEPQIVKRQTRALSSVRSAIGGGGGRSPMVGGSPTIGSGGGRRGGAPPI